MVVLNCRKHPTTLEWPKIEQVLEDSPPKIAALLKCFKPGWHTPQPLKHQDVFLVENLCDGFIFRGDLKQQQTLDQLKIDKQKKKTTVKKWERKPFEDLYRQKHGPKRQKKNMFLHRLCSLNSSHSHSLIQAMKFVRPILPRKQLKDETCPGGGAEEFCTDLDNSGHDFEILGISLFRIWTHWAQNLLCFSPACSLDLCGWYLYGSYRWPLSMDRSFDVACLGELAEYWKQLFIGGQTELTEAPIKRRCRDEMADERFGKRVRSSHDCTQHTDGWKDCILALPHEEFFS